MKSLFWQQNRHQKVYEGRRGGRGGYTGGIYICAVVVDILKFEQTSRFYSYSYFNLGVLGALFRRD